MKNFPSIKIEKNFQQEKIDGETDTPEIKEIMEEIEKTAVLSLGKIDAIEQTVRVSLLQEQNPIKQENIKVLGRKFKEAIFFYARLVVLGGLTLGVFSGDRPQKKPEIFEDMVQRAKIEMQQDGITSDQKKVYKLLISDLIYKGVSPYGYYGYDKQWKDILNNIMQGREALFASREDAWRLYLGLPQKHNTFGISDYRPTKGTSGNMYYYKIISYFDKLTHYNPGIIKNMVARLKNPEAPRDYKKFDQWWNIPGIPFDKNDVVMGTYTISHGQDKRGHYISYFDRWDLDIDIERMGLLGGSFEIYDRLYYDPETFEAIGPKEVSPESADSKLKDLAFKQGKR